MTTSTKAPVTVSQTAFAPRARRSQRVGPGVRSRSAIRTVLCFTVLACALAAGSMSTGAAQAAAGSAWWKLNSGVLPANLAPGGEGTIVLNAINLGDAATAGELTITDVLPAGLKVKETEVNGELVPEVHFFERSTGQSPDMGPAGNEPLAIAQKVCEVAGPRVTCRTEGHIEGPEPFVLAPITPFESLELRIPVTNVSAVAGDLIKGEVTGGAARPETNERKLTVSAAPPQFGVEAQGFSLVPEEEGGAIDTQAGSHPFQLTTTLALNQTADVARPPALPRNLQFKWPPGLIGNAAAISRCGDRQFRNRIPNVTANECPASTAVGVAVLNVYEPTQLQLATIAVPLFNLEPSKGEPARFGFEFVGSAVTIDTAVRSGADYGVTVSVSNATELTNFISSTVTVWGAPGDPSHDSARGWACLIGGLGGPLGSTCSTETQSQAVPFITLPSSCATPFLASVEGDSWPRRATPESEALSVPLPREQYALKDGFGRALGITGCNEEPFEPAIEVAPDQAAASTPTGMKVDVHVPQEVSQNPQGVSSSNVKDISVTFPEGVTVNPAAADGLQACPEALAGFERSEELASVPGVSSMIFSPELTEPLQPGVNTCPDASKIGAVKIVSPLLPAGQFVEGALYLATPAPNGEEGNNPFNSLLAEYILVKDPVSGVVVKLPGNVTLDPVTGRVTATFKNNPQVAFEDAEIHLFGGSRAPFSSPAHCGSYTTSAMFTPWSGGPAATSTSTFQVLSGPNGTPCPGPALPFSPSLTGGTTNINAAAFSPLTTTIGREDGNQNIQTVRLHMPPGLSGILAGVKLCPEAQANAGTCSQESLIGHTIVSVGLGNEPFSVTGGEVFLTEKYAGGQFGLSIVNPAKAGPFDLGKVIVRASINVDPSTAELTITTGQIPHILKGIPLQIKHVNVAIDRPGFTFNPTNCNPMNITGTIGSVEGATSPVSVPFQVTNCKSLAFKPKFSVSTSGKTSRKNGASLHVKLTYPKAPFGSQANIAKVKVNLPKQLPSRLTTLQKACPDSTFNANPASCPSASRIGTAKATTPLLPVALSGPVYFVSHGGAKFPELIIVLSGYGVTVDLHSETFISKAGITSSTFRTVPDVPVGTFELTLPEGKYSALAANGNLCKSTLKMPTAFTAQNGAVIHQSTPISVTGCPKAKKKKK